jgi:outer membrane protein assembly factor BamB
MKHKFHIISLTAVAALMIAGCESPTNPPSNIITVAPSPTLFVVNEGFFGHNNSSLDAMLFKTDSGKTDTISDHNVLSGMGEGNDILLNGNRAIILDNGANSIYILDVDSLKKLATIPMGIDGPNKMALIGTSLLLVTRRNQTSAAIIDLTANAVVDTIGIGEPSIAVAVLDNKAFITSGNYNAPGHLHVIDLASRKQIASSVILSDPERAVADSSSGQIVLGSDGIYQTVAPRIYWVNASTNALVDSVNAMNDSVSITFTTGGRVSLIENGTLRALDDVNHTIGAPILSNSLSYYEGYYDAASNAYYLGNPGQGQAAFTGNGTIDAYNASTGALLWSRSAGIAPAHFAFYH